MNLWIRHDTIAYVAEVIAWRRWISHQLLWCDGNSRTFLWLDSVSDLWMQRSTEVMPIAKIVYSVATTNTPTNGNINDIMLHFLIL